MPWLFQTTEPQLDFGVISKAWWRRPNFIPDSEPFIEITVPSDAAGVDEIATDFEHEGTRYVTGGWSQNMVFTRDLDLWSQGIEAPVEIPSVSTSGTGITAVVICYWAYADDKTQERSPLSAGTQLNLANQGVAWTNFPVSKNPRVTHLELWRSVDGSLPRLVLRRQIGLSGTLVENADAGDLGEAFTEDFQRFPRCRVNAFYHDRQFMAGYEKDRTVLYCSLINFPERMSSIDIRTKNGEPIIGLKVVNDYLLVLCAFSAYTVTGFTEDDIAITVAKTDIGVIGPNAMCMVHGNLELYSHLGPYRTDGASWFYIGRDIQPRFVQEYRITTQVVDAHLLPSGSNLRNYEGAWAVNNANGYCTQLYVNKHSDTRSFFTFWVGHYEGSGPAADGSYTPPLWSYDTAENDYTCGAVMTIPGSHQQELLFATTFQGQGAYLLRQNVGSIADNRGSSQAPTDHDSIGLLLRTGAEFHEDIGGDIAHGKRFTDLDVYAVSSNNPDPAAQSPGFNVKLWTGGAYAILQSAAAPYTGDLISFADRKSVV